VFAELVDGFYVNYAWTRKELKQTRNYLDLEKSHLKKENVYFGVDTFGRGSFGGGQWNCHVGVQVILKKEFSII
jgi:mannosyl-glycoprotein endo-beta-N-acetylglucosaminidase